MGNPLTATKQGHDNPFVLPWFAVDAERHPGMNGLPGCDREGESLPDQRHAFAVRMFFQPFASQLDTDTVNDIGADEAITEPERVFMDFEQHDRADHEAQPERVNKGFVRLRIALTGIKPETEETTDIRVLNV